MEFSCSFTGHRPSSFNFGYDEKHPDCIAIKRTLNKQIRILAKNGVYRFLSGVAQGVDMWAAEMVLDMKLEFAGMQLVCILPCETQADHWDENTRERYFNILSQADHTEYVSRHYTNLCMKQRNYRLVDNARFIQAVFNGNSKSGTAQTLNYARHKKRVISIIDPLKATCTPFKILQQK